MKTEGKETQLRMEALFKCFMLSATILQVCDFIHSFLLGYIFIHILLEILSLN